MASLGMLPARSPSNSQVSPLLARLLAGTKSSSSQAAPGTSTSQQQQGSPASSLPSVSLSPPLPHEVKTSPDPSASVGEDQQEQNAASPRVIIQSSTRAPISESSRAVAAAALAAVRGATSLSAAQSAGKVEVTETRRFAGKDITVSTAGCYHVRSSVTAVPCFACWVSACSAERHDGSSVTFK